MLNIIKRLEPDLINKIAAGEVIQSPVSVVKELVENSIDAQAKNIHIEIKNSGFSLIKIVDDGMGMSFEDAVLCFERHATSKIKDFEDLMNLSSMGFRGEALASIAAVANVFLQTSQNNLASFINIKASKIIKKSQVARTKGTTIEVKDLFFNVPVRKKFQKNLSSINAEIFKMVVLLALSRPDICFSLTINDKKLFFCKNISKDFKTSFDMRVKKLLPSFFDTCMQIDYCDQNIQIYGYASFPEHCTKTKSCQYLIVNKRIVLNSKILKFVKEAYFTRISKENFPKFALYIQMPNNFIDVNIHPQKTQIKLLNELFINQAIKKSLQKAFEKKFIDQKEKNFCDIEKQVFFEKPKEVIIKPTTAIENFHKQMFFDTKYEISIDNFLQIDRYVFIDIKYLQNIIDIDPKQKIAIIDLSALFFHTIFTNLKKDSSLIQKFLIPLSIELNKDQMLFVEDNLSKLQSFGFDLRLISENQILIDGFLQDFSSNIVKDLFFLVLQDLKKHSHSYEVQNQQNKKFLNSLSSLSKQKQYSKKEAEKLLDVFVKEKILCDPLGKPVILKINTDNIEKMFDRLK